MIDLKVSPTTIGFSPEGASIYVGTENGKLLVQDLRALDKPPKSFIVSELGHSIDTLAVQVGLYLFKLFRHLICFSRKKSKAYLVILKGKGHPEPLLRSWPITRHLSRRLLLYAHGLLKRALLFPRHPLEEYH